MEGHNDQAKLPTVVIEKYLPAAVEALSRAFKDQMVADAFLAAFTAKQITFTVEPDSFVEDKTAPAFWNGSNGLRLIDGKLDIFIKKSSFWVNTNSLEQVKIDTVLANLPKAAGALPLDVQVKLRDTKVVRDAEVARAAKALGIDALTYDAEADYSQILAAAPAKADVGAYTQYFKALATLFERQAKDEMVKEAIVDALSAKKVSVRVVADMKAVTGLKMDNGYNGVQIDGGVITVITTAGDYWTNVSKLEQLDLIKLF